MARTEIKTEVVRKVITEVATTEVSLDDTNANELIAELVLARDAVDRGERLNKLGNSWFSPKTI